MYGSTVYPEGDINSGLVGLMVVDQGDGTSSTSRLRDMPSSVNREFVLFNMVFNEVGNILIGCSLKQ